MKKLLVIAISGLLFFNQFNILVVQAFNEGLNKTADVSGFDTDNATSGTGEDLLIQKITTVLSMILSLLGVVFLILIIYSGYKWMNARDNAGDIDKAKTSITNAIIGLIVILSAYAITLFVKSGLSGLIG